MSRAARAFALSVVLLSPAALAACGDGASPTASAEFCSIWKKTNDADAGAHGADSSVMDDPASMKKSWESAVALAEQLLAVAPADVKDDIATMVANLKEQNKVMADGKYDITAMAKDPGFRARMDEVSGDPTVSEAKVNYVKFADEACDTNYGAS